MGKKSQSLLFKFAVIFVVFTVFTLFMAGFATYQTQSSAYKNEREVATKQVASYLEEIITADGNDFAYWQKHFLAHYKELLVPHSFTSYDVQIARKKYEDLFYKRHPGKILDVNISFDELSEDVKDAYTVYKHEYYLNHFEQARLRFNLAYVEYIIPFAETYHIMYALDSMRDERIIDGKKYIELGITVEHKPEEHQKEWEAWNTGMRPSGFDTFDNEYGKDYAWYSPVFINGVKLGLIGVEVDILKLNKTILDNTIRQMLYIGLIIVVMVFLVLVYIYRHYIKKLSHLKDSVKLYSQGKNANIASDIEKNATGQDEISVLAMQVSSMILELENYMRNLLETAKELRDTKQKADAMNELATKDALTGIRNKTAYDTAVKQLDQEIGQGAIEFSIAMIDLNYLKRINDTFGHEQGNIAIKRLCYIVCHVFKHSPVFRIGGDEFIVILKNDDYKNRIQLLEDFNKGIEVLSKDDKLSVWERVSAAIGMADFNPAVDSSVENVFARADKAMYQRKKEMKAARD